MRFRWIIPVLLAAVSPSVFAQTMSLYDGFSGPSLDASRWEVISEEGTALAGATTAGGYLTVSGKDNRTGAASIVRLPDRGAVEVDALGWSGTNQILQLYSGDGAFNHFIEFGEEGTAADGTPILNVWTPSGRLYRANSPVTGPADPAHPTTLRIERDGADYRFLANGTPVFSARIDALNNDARVVLYGWRGSVSRWDNVRLSGPDCRINAPAENAVLTGSADIFGWTQDGTAAWLLQWGAGASPAAWTTLASGAGAVNGKLAHWDAAGLAGGTYAFRLLATDVSGESRAAWSTVTLARPTLIAPVEGQRVGPAFTVALGMAQDFVRADYYEDGALIATSASPPLFRARRVEPEGASGEHTLTAVLTDARGNAATTAPVPVTVQSDLYGANTRPDDTGKAFRFPWGQTTVAIGQNDGYLWAGCVDLYNGNAAATERYVTDLAAHGVNVMRIMMDEGNNPADFLENPIGTYNPKVVAFWDAFFEICNRHHMTVLVTPWDTFWMNSEGSWAKCAYNAANGGPCATVHDFLTSPAARKAQKDRFKFIIDRWGNNPAIFGIDLLNEFDIWWNASESERADWINDMAAYVQGYELSRWGHRHMLTVSTAAANPTGLIGDIQYRYPLFDFSNTHQYYGSVSNPQDIISPALEVNAGTKDSITQSPDNRPYFDSESGPIALSAPWLTNETAFDDQYYHHMAWAHFATGGTGVGQRWPYRWPHCVDAGMHDTDAAIARVAALFNWERFVPANIDGRLSVDRPGFIAMGCADAGQALVWLTEDIRSKGTKAVTGDPVSGARLTITGVPDGLYAVNCWNPYTGGATAAVTVARPIAGQVVVALTTVSLDLAVTLRRMPPGDVNGDLKVTVADAQQVLRCAAGLTKLTADQAAAADLDGNGAIDVGDALCGMRSAMGLVP